MKKLFKKFRSNIPLLIIILVSVFIALQNTSIRGFYSGWDNIHAEINLQQYAYRSLFGAWEEHAGLGGPAAKGHLAEITRIPYLLILKTIFPTYLVRAVFLFTMFSIGGMTMYFFIKKYWTQNKSTKYKTWIAGFAGLFYLLHPLTLQQFYISFELFTVQFAFFPLLLICIHKLATNVSAKTILFFSLTQLLLASSGHTPTVFYLGAMISIFYAVAVHLQTHKKFLASLRFGFLVGLLTLITNGFWILPNLYYTINNSHYVTESKANIVFGPEALWSIREASTVHSYLTGYHYLTSWKDYKFSTKEHELIFNEWVNKFANPFSNLQLYILSSLAIVGAIIATIKAKKYPVKVAAALIFLFTSSFIWIELFPTKDFLLTLYKSKTFLEIFRNPFTKLSILHSVFVVILASQTLITLAQFLQKKSKQLTFIIMPIVLGLLYAYVFSITSPSFSGNFINDKLYVIFPPEYEAMYSFLKTKNHAYRTLEMPYTSREGWVLYDWSTPNQTNGYQGMGFYFFGMPQPFLTSDFARWSGVNDYFFEELSFALNSQNSQQLELIAKKYIVPLAILDESRVQPYIKHSFELDKEMLKNAGYKPIWKQNFLTVYEHPEIATVSSEFIVPKSITKVSADTVRLSQDPVIKDYNEHIVVQPESNLIQYPFSWLQKTEVETQSPSNSQLVMQTKVAPGKYEVVVPALAETSFNTTVALRIDNSKLEIIFPQYSLKSNAIEHKIKTIDNHVFNLSNQVTALQIGEVQVAINEINPYTYTEIFIPVGENIVVRDVATRKILAEIIPDWQTLTQNQLFNLNTDNLLELYTNFPTIVADLTLQPSENCIKPQVGSIQTKYSLTGAATYTANNFGVNCNSITLPYISPVNEYIARISGENILGRSIKLFVHYSKPNTTPTEYIFPPQSYQVSYTLKKLSSDSLDRLFLNWETRSFGLKSENRLDSLTLTPFPINSLSAIKLVPTNNSEDNVRNSIKVLEQKKHSLSRYSAKITCTDTCYFGINQTFDDLWIAFDTTNSKILPHYKYNNWANLWQTNKGESDIVIFYLPQCVAFVGMLAASGIILISLYFVVKHPKKKIKKTRFDKVMQVILGK